MPESFSPGAGIEANDSPQKDIDTLISDDIENLRVKSYVQEYLGLHVHPHPVLKTTVEVVLNNQPEMVEKFGKDLLKVDDQDKEKIMDMVKDLVKQALAIDMRQRLKTCRPGTVKDVVDPYEKAGTSEELDKFFEEQKSCKLPTFEDWKKEKAKAEEEVEIKKRDDELKRKQRYEDEMRKKAALRAELEAMKKEYAEKELRAKERKTQGLVFKKEFMGEAERAKSRPLLPTTPELLAHLSSESVPSGKLQAELREVVTQGQGAQLALAIFEKYGSLKDKGTALKELKTLEQDFRDYVDDALISRDLGGPAVNLKEALKVTMDAAGLSPDIQREFEEVAKLDPVGASLLAKNLIVNRFFYNVYGAKYKVGAPMFNLLVDSDGKPFRDLLVREKRLHMEWGELLVEEGSGMTPRGANAAISEIELKVAEISKKRLEKGMGVSDCDSLSFMFVHMLSLIATPEEMARMKTLEPDTANHLALAFEVGGTQYVHETTTNNDPIEKSHYRHATENGIEGIFYSPLADSADNPDLSSVQLLLIASSEARIGPDSQVALVHRINTLLKVQGGGKKATELINDFVKKHPGSVIAFRLKMYAQLKIANESTGEEKLRLYMQLLEDFSGRLEAFPKSPELYQVRDLQEMLSTLQDVAKVVINKLAMDLLGDPQGTDSAEKIKKKTYFEKYLVVVKQKIDQLNDFVSAHNAKQVVPSP